jgi:hypothetical protein
LDQEISYFNWTGFYFKNGDKDELKLGPYVGAPTDHTIIPYGKEFAVRLLFPMKRLLFLMYMKKAII